MPLSSPFQPQLSFLIPAHARGAPPLHLNLEPGPAEPFLELAPPTASLRASVRADQRLHGIFSGVFRLFGQQLLLNAEPLPDVQGGGDRGLRGGKDLPHTPPVRRRVSTEGGGHHRRGLPRETVGCGWREH